MSHSNTFHRLPLINIRESLDVETPQVSKHLFTVKSPFANKRYTELDIFRQQIEQSKAGVHHQLYTYHKKSVNFYKTVFFSFALLFATLGITAMNLHSGMAFNFLFTHVFIKGVIVSLCLLLTLSSLGIAIGIRTDREAVLHLVRKAKATLATIYAHKRLRHGLKRVFIFSGIQRRQSTALKQMYHEICDKINDQKDESLHLVNRIKISHTLSPQDKEVLFNQAVEELHDKLILLTHSFRKAAPPHFG